MIMLISKASQVIAAYEDLNNRYFPKYGNNLM